MHATVVEIGVSWHGNGVSGGAGAESVKRHHVMDFKKLIDKFSNNKSMSFACQLF
jgi:hypothetical protein